MKTKYLLAIGLVASVLAASQAHATDQGITGKKLLLKSGKIVLLSKDPGISISGSDPVGGADSSITFDDGNGAVKFDLPAGNWGTNGSATLFKYKNPLAPNGPSAVKIAKVKGGLLKVVAKGLPFAVPNDSATISVKLSLDGGTNTYCMTFSGSGDGNKFLRKDSPAGTCAVCGDNVWDPETGEYCDGTDDAQCAGPCQPDCTCNLCGNNVVDQSEFCDGTDDAHCAGPCQPDCTCDLCGNSVQDPGEDCDGTDDSLCPGFCQGDCTCDLSPVCCDLGGSCQGGYDAASCFSFGGTPVTGGAVCDSSGACVSGPGTPGPCCEAESPFESACIVNVSQSQCETAPNGTYFPSGVCSPEGSCAFCGNGVIEGTEECDGSNDAACPNDCLPDCSCADECPASGDATACVAFRVSGSACQQCCQAAVGACQPCLAAVNQGCAGVFNDTCTNLLNTAGCAAECGCSTPCEASTGGYCWFLGDSNQSCDTVCAAAGRTCSVQGTVSYAGSMGSQTQCAVVLNALGAGIGAVTSGGGDGVGGYGCFILQNTQERYWYPNLPTTCSASSTNRRRVCACE